MKEERNHDLDHDFLETKDCPDTILVSIDAAVCTDLLAALEYYVLLHAPALPLEVGIHFLLIMDKIEGHPLGVLCFGLSYTSID
jgi:hypothetical protein